MITWVKDHPVLLGFCVFLGVIVSSTEVLGFSTIVAKFLAVRPEIGMFLSTLLVTIMFLIAGWTFSRIGW